MRLAAKISAIVFPVLFVLCAFEIWILIQLVGAGKGFWSVGFVQLTIFFLAMAVILWSWLLYTKNKDHKS